MLKLTIILISAISVSGQDKACGSADTSWPDNLINYGLTSQGKVLHGGEKNGNLRHFVCKEDCRRLTFSATIELNNPTKVGLFIENTAGNGKYSTNGTTTCTNPKEFKEPADCASSSKRFQGLTDFCKDRNITRTVGTQLTSGDFLFIVHTTSKTKSAENYQVLLDKNGSLKVSIKLTSRPPTALTSLGHKDGDHDVLTVAFDNIAGRYLYKSSQNAELSISRTVNYQSSRYWLSCAPDICFDGNIGGAVTRSSVDSILFYRSFYRVYLDNKITDSKNDLDSVDRYVFQGASSGEILSSYGDQCSQGTSIVSCFATFDQLAAISPTGNLDAMFSLPGTNNLYIIYGDQYGLYLEKDKNFTHSDHGPMSALFPGLPKKLDGATAKGDSVLFIYDNFVYWTKIAEIKSKKAPVYRVSLIQELFENGVCNDNYYLKSTSAQLLNISTFSEFKTYRMQFVTTAVPTSPTSPTDIMTSTESTDANASKADKKSLSITSILIFSLLIIAVIAAVFMWYSNKMAKPVAQKNPNVDDVARSPVVSANSNIPAKDPKNRSQMNLATGI
ncbi:hypothetical protein HDE_01559 [Halotydeus destructor]|nr:hypothetical protein HDE_01559 [Halotydeus destructor]